MIRFLLFLAAAFAYVAWRNRPRYVQASVTVENDTTYAGGGYGGPSRTVFHFADGTVGPGDWDPRTGTVLPAGVH